MKRITLIIALTLLTLLQLHAQETGGLSKTAPLGGKKYGIGIGVGTHWDGQPEINMKFDYHLTKKFAIGLRTVLCQNKSTDYYEKIDSTMIASRKSQPGHIFDIVLAGTYYIAGNCSSSKEGMYITLGIGYQDYKQSDNMNETFPYDPYSSFSFTATTRYRSLSAQVALGGEYKVGPGRIFFEIPLYCDLTGTYSHTYTNKVGNLVPSDSSVKEEAGDGGAIYLNLGYVFFF
jgi:hypothetical protein